MLRLGARVDSALTFLIQCATGSHDTLKGADAVFRELKLSEDTVSLLAKARESVRVILHGEGLRVLQVWVRKLMRECEGKMDDDTLDNNTELMCNVYAHMLMMLRNFTIEELSVEFVGRFVESSIFLSTRHKWNTGGSLDDEW